MRGGPAGKADDGPEAGSDPGNFPVLVLDLDYLCSMGLLACLGFDSLPRSECGRAAYTDQPAQEVSPLLDGESQQSADHFTLIAVTPLPECPQPVFACCPTLLQAFPPEWGVPPCPWGGLLPSYS